MAALEMAEVAEGLASSSGLGRSDASRGGGGKRQAGWREGGGRSAEPGRRVGGAEGKGSGQRGRGRGGGVGLGTRLQRKRQEGEKGEEDSCGQGGPQRAFFFSRFPNLSPPRLPSLFCPGLEPQTLRHNSPTGAGGEATAKLSANFTAWRDLGCEARPAEGGDEWLTQVARPGRQHPLHPGQTGPPAPPPSRFLLPKFLAAKHPQLLCLGGPLPRLEEKGRSPGSRHQGEEWGRGRQGPSSVCRKPTVIACPF